MVSIAGLNIRKLDTVFSFKGNSIDTLCQCFQGIINCDLQREDKTSSILSLEL